jgi:hypothetical protein
MTLYDTDRTIFPKSCRPIHHELSTCDGERIITRSATEGLKMYRTESTSLLFLLLCICVQLQDSVAEGDDDDKWIDSEWMGLVRYLLAAFFVTVGLHLLLYSHMTTRSLLQAYMHMDKAVCVPGDVLSCEEISQNPGKFDVAVLYKAPVQKYSGGARSVTNNRRQFRNPDRIEEKRFLRRFQLQHPIARGTVVPILRFPGRPKSGMLLEVVQDMLAQHSVCRTVLILVPGLLLLTVIVWLAVQTIQDNMEDERQTIVAYFVLGVSLGVFMLGSKMYCDAKFQKERSKRFESAVPMVNKPEESRGNAGKSEALLNESQYSYHENNMTGPVVVAQGTDDQDPYHQKNMPVPVVVVQGTDVVYSRLDT